jgi:hypothetical protein
LALAQGKRHFKKQKKAGKRQKEKGRRPKCKFSPSASLHLPIQDSTRRFQHFRHLLRADRGFLLRLRAIALQAKSNGTNAKKLYWVIGYGVFVCTIICHLQADSRQLATAGVGK